MPPATLQPAHEPLRTPERSRQTPHLERSSRVLIVEDEPLTAEVFARALTRDGHRVEVARDGLQALRRLHDRPPALLVLDMNLPAIPGADVVRQLRQEGHADLPIIVVSGSPRTQGNLTAAELWPGMWIAKPVRPRELVQIVRDFLREVD